MDLKVGTTLALVLLAGAGWVGADDPRWVHFTSARGDLPAPSTSTQQTGALVADLDADGIQDFVLSFRKVAPALVWYRRSERGWQRYAIEPAFLTVEAGGAAHDIDGDGDLDLVVGGDWQSPEVWWWENPRPHFDPALAWTRTCLEAGRQETASRPGVRRLPRHREDRARLLEPAGQDLVPGQDP